ncbi:helix-turn-helix domain-containing protein [Hansschlegelia quercus]|uniref:XRE family transcriptional regulator n=1 Tax=Hansschlegelia quercus TaxID=2528245 RepID=A0A4Q9GM11_9HYPH|nr:XRE family transcriptional regulator [Hansschlegelia quercus]
MVNAQLVKAARIIVGWSQQDLASRCGFSRDTISQLESNLTKPRERTILKIIDVFYEAGVELLDEDLSMTIRVNKSLMSQE